MTADGDVAGGTPKRRTVLFAGHVQGVGFRYTTIMVARSYDVTGSVRNLPDGRVELIAEGVPSELDRFERAVSETMSTKIVDVDVTIGEATGEFTSFGISF